MCFSCLFVVHAGQVEDDIAEIEALKKAKASADVVDDVAASNLNLLVNAVQSAQTGESANRAAADGNGTDVGGGRLSKLCEAGDMVDSGEGDQAKGRKQSTGGDGKGDDE